MTYHILNGDALAGTFRRSSIAGEIIISREALIEGPCDADSIESFWDDRAAHIKQTYRDDSYFLKVKSEFDRLLNVSPDDEVNLWFENDLFCQTNMWFVVSLINKLNVGSVYRVAPLIRNERKWEGFGRHTSNDLELCFEKRTLFTRGDFRLGENLWEAYRKDDVVALAVYSKSLSPCYPFLEEVAKAEVERKRNRRPRKVLEDLLAKGYTEFDEIFRQFNQTEAIYGFGDSQVDHMLKEIKP